jgi:hypothetical protein
MSIFRKEKPSAKELQDALAAIDLAALAAAVATATDERAKLLIDGTDEAVLLAEQAVTAARLAHDRAQARKTELERRIVEAEQREADARLEADRVKVAKAADALAKNLKQRYIDAAGALVAVLTELDSVEAAIYNINQRLGAAGWLDNGRASQIATVENRIPEFDWRASGSTTSLRSKTYLKLVLTPGGRPDKNIPTWPLPEGRIR